MAGPAGAIAAVIALVLLLVLWLQDDVRVPEAAVLALAALLFATATLAVGLNGFRVQASGVAWVGTAFAAAASLVVLTDRRLLRSIRRPTAYEAAVVGSAAAVVTSLFLPWQTTCYPDTADYAGSGVAGRCFSANGLDLGFGYGLDLTIQ